MLSQIPGVPELSTIPKQFTASPPFMPPPSVAPPPPTRPKSCSQKALHTFKFVLPPNVPPPPPTRTVSTGISKRHNPSHSTPEKSEKSSTPAPEVIPRKTHSHHRSHHRPRSTSIDPHTVSNPSSDHRTRSKRRHHKRTQAPSAPPPPPLPPPPPSETDSVHNAYRANTIDPRYQYLDSPQEDFADLDSLFGFQTLPIMRKNSLKLLSDNKNNISPKARNKAVRHSLEERRVHKAIGATGLELIVSKSGDSINAKYSYSDSAKSKKRRARSVDHISMRKDPNRISSVIELCELIDELKNKIREAEREKQMIEDNVAILQQRMCDKNEALQLLELELEEIENM
ncbi:hypothetical protein GPJ56_000596 [Histomonas meleagridis]|uniref:uncharacterized protein n=1 Tax=Histomonas meleagridis TaxID=135588 RepID=UPI0035594DB0|nr:hypothetical protein GPJ56_000596 [Histomonas meleagridis]KAH0796363.1 hypothetical protein GO595_010256 [Histomonas meleagridis]